MGVDGEGGNIPDASALFGTTHEYLLLRAGPDTVENASGLSFAECAHFLCSLPQGRIYVSYFFDYDVTMIIKGIPEERARRLYNRSLREHKEYGRTLPVEYQGYEFDYLPHKEFRIRRVRPGNSDQPLQPWIVINDVGQFFQTSFLSTLDKWQVGTAREREQIGVGKAQRAVFAEVTEEIRAYNALECLLLEQLMEDFRTVCIDVGYIPKKWQGPGNLASAMLEHHGIPRRKDIPIMMNDDFRRIANDAYYGGRFETTVAGPVSGPVYQYDINSAYPAILRGLPCLLHGSWRRTFDRPSEGLWLGSLHFNHRTPRYLYNFPVRDKHGNISYPKEANGVYWSTEVVQAEAAGSTVEFEVGWEYERHCSCVPFSFIDDYYLKRLALGKTTKGYVLKLAGNSLYGKMAQSIGYAPYANPIWAGLITAGCRGQIVNAYARDPLNCYMIATDGIFVGNKLDLPVSKNLGDWDLTEHDEGIFIVQPGIYYVGSGDVKTRGVERGRINQRRDDFERAWQKFLDSNGEDHTVSIPVDNFITGRQALGRNKWNIAGRWESDYRQISFDWSNKRNRSAVFTGMRGELRTTPRNGSPTLFSVPYDKLIGGNAREWNNQLSSPGLAEKRRYEEQPDWVEPLFNVE